MNKDGRQYYSSELNRIRELIKYSAPGGKEEVLAMIEGWNGKDSYAFFQLLKGRGCESLFALAQEYVDVKEKLENAEE